MFLPYDIVYEKVDECPYNNRPNHCFEIIYIISGIGKQQINGHTIPYNKGDLLLLTPKDICNFEVIDITEFLFISFHKKYIENNALCMENSLKLDYLLQTATTTKGCILYNSADKYLVKYLTEGIVRELINNSLYSKGLIEQLMNALILIVGRNLVLTLPTELYETSEEKIVNILQFVQANIYQPENIKLERIGEEFGLSTTYVSRYFKKHTQKTLQEYIAQFRINLIVNKLLYTNLRIGEIALELGFTDESHLNRFFKKEMKISPLKFRKENLKIY